jgi:hypothetical protein
MIRVRVLMSGQSNRSPYKAYRSPFGPQYVYATFLREGRGWRARGERVYSGDAVQRRSGDVKKEEGRVCLT